MVLCYSYIHLVPDSFVLQQCSQTPNPFCFRDATNMVTPRSKPPSCPVRDLRESCVQDSGTCRYTLDHWPLHQLCPHIGDTLRHGTSPLDQEGCCSVLCFRLLDITYLQPMFFFFLLEYVYSWKLYYWSLIKLNNLQLDSFIDSFMC